LQVSINLSIVLAPTDQEIRDPSVPYTELGINDLKGNMFNGM